MYLEVCHPCLLSLQQSFKLQVRLHLVEEHHLAVHVLPGGVEEVCKEPTDAAVGDVAAHNDELFLSRSLWLLECFKAVAKILFLLYNIHHTLVCSPATQLAQVSRLRSFPQQLYSKR